METTWPRMYKPQRFEAYYCNYYFLLSSCIKRTDRKFVKWTNLLFLKRRINATIELSVTELIYVECNDVMMYINY